MGLSLKSLAKPFTKVFKPVVKFLRPTKLFNFLGNINPFVALGIFAVGWLFTDH